METFTTHITFASGDTHTEDTLESEVLSTITRLVRGPAARLGMIDEVRIVDMSDCIVFHAIRNEIIFPRTQINIKKSSMTVQTNQKTS